jgi:hypothetical protein
LTFASAVLCGLAASCVSQPPPSIKSDQPEQAIPAIESEVRAGHKSAIPYLVRDLQSYDSAMRMYAIDGLRRLTGQDFGYVYYEEPELRQPAVERWNQWLAEQPAQ